MKRSAKRKLAAVAATGLVLAGGALAAVSATGQGTPPVRRAARSKRVALGDAHGMLSQTGAYLDLPVAQLRSQLRSGKTLAQIANATAGRSEAGLIEVLVARKDAKLAAAAASLPSRVRAEVNTPMIGTAGGRGPLFLAAGYLGLSGAQLRAGLRSGETLAQLANTTAGKSEAGLIEVLLTARKARLSAAVAAGTLPEADKQRRLPELAGRIRAFVNRTRSKHRSS